MSKKSLTPIEAGENVLRQTIQMINSELRGAIKEYNRRAGSSWQKWDYNEVFSQIAGCFAGTDMAVRAAEVDKKPLYLRMKYPTLIAYNNYLFDVLKNLDNRYKMRNAIEYAKIDSTLPDEYYYNCHDICDISYKEMVEGMNAIRAEMAHRFGKYNFNVNYLDAVMQKRKKLEEERAQMRIAKKLAKAAAAKKVAEQTFGTTTPQTKQAHEAKLWEDEIALEERNEYLRESAGEIGFDEDGMPVRAVRNKHGYIEWVYEDGTIYDGNVYDEERNACIDRDYEEDANK